MIEVKTLYDTDSVAWADQQAQLLRGHQWEQLDLENLIEEVQDLGGRHRDRIESLQQNLLMRLLKRDYQPQKRTRSWDITIQTSALNIRKEIQRRPSLRRHFIAQFDQSYEYARELASIETTLPLERFPAQCLPEMRYESWQLCEIDE